MEPRRHKPKVFISYSRMDERYVRSLREALASTTDVVILDPTREVQKSGRIVDKIQKSLKQSDFVVTFLSPQSTESRWVLMELGMAKALGKKVIAILLPGTDISSVPFTLRDQQVIISTGPKSTAERLIREVLEVE